MSNSIRMNGGMMGSFSIPQNPWDGNSWSGFQLWAQRMPGDRRGLGSSNQGFTTLSKKKGLECASQGLGIPGEFKRCLLGFPGLSAPPGNVVEVLESEVGILKWFWSKGECWFPAQQKFWFQKSQQPQIAFPSSRFEGKLQKNQERRTQCPLTVGICPVSQTRKEELWQNKGELF